MPKFCSDYCRRQPVQAEFQLQNAIAHRNSAQRTIDQLTANLERYRQLELAETVRLHGARDAETRSGSRPRAETSQRSSDAGDAERVPA